MKNATDKTRPFILTGLRLSIAADLKNLRMTLADVKSVGTEAPADEKPDLRMVYQGVRDAIRSLEQAEIDLLAVRDRASGESLTKLISTLEKR